MKLRLDYGSSSAFLEDLAVALGRGETLWALKDLTVCCSSDTNNLLYLAEAFRHGACPALARCAVGGVYGRNWNRYGSR